MCVCCVCEKSMNHISLKNGKHRYCAKSPTAQSIFWPLLISCAGTHKGTCMCVHCRWKCISLCSKYYRNVWVWHVVIIVVSPCVGRSKKPHALYSIWKSRKWKWNENWKLERETGNGNKTMHQLAVCCISQSQWFMPILDMHKVGIAQESPW